MGVNSCKHYAQDCHATSADLHLQPVGASSEAERLESLNSLTSNRPQQLLNHQPRPLPLASSGACQADQSGSVEIGSEKVLKKPGK